MGWHFLYPQFLWALSVLTVPIVIHLFNFRKYQKVYFTNVHLLKSLKKETRSKSKIKEWLILLMRLLLLATLVLMFAQPIKINRSGNYDQSSERALVLLVDNSFSMSAESSHGVLIENAKNQTLSIVQQYPVNTKCMLISSELKPEDQFFKAQNQIANSIANLKVSPFTYSLDRAINTISNIVDKNGLINVDCFILSDFQKDQNSISALSDSSLNMFFVPQKVEHFSNIAIDTIFFLSNVHSLPDKEHLVYKITNYANLSIPDYKVSLYINDSLRSIETVSLLEYQTITDTIVFQNRQPGIQKANIGIDDFPMTFDNNYYFSYNIQSKFEVGFVASKPSKYISALFKDRQLFDFNYQSWMSADWSSLLSVDLLVATVDKNVSVDQLSNLLNYANLGGHLVLILNEENDYLSSLGVIISETDSTTQTINEINISSDLFKNAIETDKSELYLPTINNSISLKGNEEWLLKADHQTIAAFYKKNKAHMLALSVPTEKNEAFYTHPLIIPLFYNFCMQKASSPAYYQSGIDAKRFISDINLKQDDVLKLKFTNEELIPEQYAVDQGIELVLPLRTYAGFYDILSKDTLIDALAFNYSRSESSDQFWTEKELNELPGAKVFEANANNADKIKEAAGQTEPLWYWFLLLSLLFLAAEISLIIFWRKG
ncbi:MAG: BatA and WFA domain-containing protein [Bacteroidales bacterium]|nr:BatA and WFA domain-containing protein [Bacteroidales bacterium]